MQIYSAEILWRVLGLEGIDSANLLDLLSTNEA